MFLFFFVYIYIFFFRASFGRRWVFLQKGSSSSSLKRRSTWWSVWVCEMLLRFGSNGASGWLCLCFMGAGQPAGVPSGSAAVHPGRLRGVPVLRLCESAAVSGAVMTLNAGTFMSALIWSFFLYNEGVRSSEASRICGAQVWSQVTESEGGNISVVCFKL